MRGAEAIMAVNVGWDTKMEDVILYEFTGKWTWQEFLLGFEREIEMAASLDGRRYDVIGDTSEGPNLPGGSGITHIYSIFRRYPKNWGVTIIVTRSSFIRAMYKVGARVHPDAKNAFIIVGDIDEARALIRERRAEVEHADKH